MNVSTIITEKKKLPLVSADGTGCLLLEGGGQSA
jgi:hypothetical protein